MGVFLVTVLIKDNRSGNEILKEKFKSLIKIQSFYWSAWCIYKFHLRATQQVFVFVFFPFSTTLWGQMLIDMYQYANIDCPWETLCKITPWSDWRPWGTVLPTTKSREILAHRLRSTRVVIFHTLFPILNQSIFVSYKCCHFLSSLIRKTQKSQMPVF